MPLLIFPTLGFERFRRRHFHRHLLLIAITSCLFEYGCHYRDTSADTTLLMIVPPDLSHFRHAEYAISCHVDGAATHIAIMSRLLRTFRFRRAPLTAYVMFAFHDDIFYAARHVTLMLQHYLSSMRHAHAATLPLLSCHHFHLLLFFRHYAAIRHILHAATLLILSFDHLPTRLGLRLPRRH